MSVIANDDVKYTLSIPRSVWEKFDAICSKDGLLKIVTLNKILVNGVDKFNRGDRG
jgi:hypothetical protein